MTFDRRAIHRAAMAACAALVLAGCAGLPSMASKPEDIVRERAAARWKAQIARDWDTSYSFFAPSYRAMVSLNRYRSSFGSAAAWTGVEVASVACEADVCTARIKVDFRAAMPSTGSLPGRPQVMSTYLNERWVREDGQWWLFQPL